MSTFKRNGIPAIVSLVIIAILYYALIPPINIQAAAFWWFLIYCVVVVTVCFALPRMGQAGSDFIGDIRDEGLHFFTNRKNRASKGGSKAPLAVAVILVVLLAVLFVGNIVSSTFFNARSYSNLITVEDGDFAEDIAEIDMSSVPVVDRSTAVRLGSRTIGEMSDLVSQYSIDESSNAYTQISYKETPYRVSSLQYADIIKWITNTGQGLPGYVTVNMVTQETELVRLDEGAYMHYSTGEHFNNYLYRHVRFQYPTEIFGDAAFEIDDDGVPYWIVPTVKYRIMLFGGMDYDGAILVNAVTGETVKYDLDSVPTWVDKVFSADLVYDQLGSYGKYRSGFWNSLIGQSGVLVPTGSTAPSLFSGDEDSTTSTTTSGYNYLAIDDDVYMYTGMTSANSDESLVGFVLVNLRTKATSYYTCAGATESSAMNSAEGQVQQMEYEATSPLLLNIADRPTYFLSLKDSAGLVKMYAFIDVQQYQIVGTGSTIDEAQENYVRALGSSDEVDVDPNALEEAASQVEAQEVTGTIEAIESVVKDGSTYYYFTLEDDANVYVAAIDLSVKLPFFIAGDEVHLLYQEAETSRTVTAIGEPGEDLTQTATGA